MKKLRVLESLSKSGIGMRVGLRVARMVPRGAAEKVIDFGTSRFLAGSVTLHEASRLNQWVVSDKTLSGEALDRAICDNARMMGRFLYDFYHVLGNDDAEDHLIVFDDVTDTFLHQHKEDGPFVYAGAHFGNFDLMMRVLGRYGLSVQVLSVADPNAGYQWQNKIRRQEGLEVTPVTLESLKQAYRTLAGGRSVLTGLDRPLPEPDKVQPAFFGHQAPLPLLHVRLAMKTRVPVIVLTAPRTEDGRYRLLMSPPIEMVGDRMTPEVLRKNAERCLDAAAGMIRTDPCQWAMPHCVWPEITLPEQASRSAGAPGTTCGG